MKCDGRRRLTDLSEGRRHGRCHVLFHLGEFALNGAAGRIEVAAAAEGLGDRTNVDVASRPQAHPDDAVFPLFEVGDGLDTGDGTGDVDDLLGVFRTGAGALERAAIGGDHGQLAVASNLQALQRLAEQADRGQAAVIVDPVGHLRRPGAGVDHLRGGAEGAAGGVGVAEVAGVGGEGDKEIGGGLGGRHQARFAVHQPHHFADRGRLVVEEVDDTVGGVGGVVVDVEDRDLGQSLEAGAVETGALDGDHEIVGRRKVLGQFVGHRYVIGAGQVAEVGRSTVAIDDDGLHTESVGHLGKRELRAEGVAVRVAMAGDEHPVGFFEASDGFRGVRALEGHWSSSVPGGVVSSPGNSPSSARRSKSRSMRSPYS